MSAGLLLPLSTILTAARDRQLTEALVIGRNAAGDFAVMSTHGTAESIKALLYGAAKKVGEPAPAGDISRDLNRTGTVRQSGENDRKSHEDAA